MIRFVVLSLALASCTITPGPVNPDPAPQPAPEPGPDGDDACAKMCQHRRALRCPDGDPTPDGSACETVCRTDSADPAARLTPTYLACLARGSKCSDDATCPR